MKITSKTKRIMVILLTVTLLIGLSACDKTKDGTKTPKVENTNRKADKIDYITEIKGVKIPIVSVPLEKPEGPVITVHTYDPVSFVEWLSDSEVTLENNVLSGFGTEVSILSQPPKENMTQFATNFQSEIEMTPIGRKVMDVTATFDFGDFITQVSGETVTAAKINPDRVVDLSTFGGLGRVYMEVFDSNLFPWQAILVDVPDTSKVAIDFATDKVLLKGNLENSEISFKSSGAFHKFILQTRETEVLIKDQDGLPTAWIKGEVNTETPPTTDANTGVEIPEGLDGIEVSPLTNKSYDIYTKQIPLVRAEQ